jgi:cell division protein FtsB
MDSSHNDLYAMNYGAFGVIAIKAIQEQQATIDSQKNDIKELKKLVEKLEQQITAITSSPHRAKCQFRYTN